MLLRAVGCSRSGFVVAGRRGHMVGGIGVGDVAVLVDVQSRPAVVHSAFDVLVPADGEAGYGNVGCGDP